MKEACPSAVAVLGGGISGLGAALAAARAGLSCTLFEKEAKTGGLWGSSERDGFIFDHGVHGLYAAGPATEETVKALRDIVGDVFVETNKNTKILFKDKLITYPLQPAEFFTAYGSQGLWWAATLLGARLRTSIKGESWMRSFRDYVEGNFGDLLYRTYFEPYVTKVWGVDPAYLDLESVARRVKRIRVRSFLKQVALRGLRMGASERSYDGMQPMKIIYPRNGAQTVVDALQREACAAGAVIATDTSVTGLSYRDGGYDIVVRTSQGEEQRIRADAVISTLPLPDLLVLLFPDPSREVAEVIYSLKYRAIRICNILLNCERIFEAQWTYFQGGNFSFSRINEYKNLSPSFCPPNKTSLSVEFNCDVGDHIWNLPEEELFSRVATELDQPIGPFHDVGAKVRQHAAGSFSIKLSHGYPLMEIGTAKHLSRAFKYVEQFPQIRTIGRQGRFCYVNGDECVAMAFAAVEELKQARGVP
jgi:protoporphyrinogen oxidase